MMCDIMRLDMTLWGKSGTSIYGIAITIDYENNKYGWRSRIVDSGKTSLAESCFGDIYVSALNPPHTILATETAPTFVNTLLLEEFIDKLLPHLNNCIIYTGAGMSSDAGIWDLKQLRENLFLDNIDKFSDATSHKKNEILLTIKEFAHQLYETTPTESYRILSELQSKYNITIVTENRDILHQKSGHKVFTRDILKRFPLWLLNKTLIIIGLSDDHSGIIWLYHSMNKDTPFFIINNSEIPRYCTDIDWFCSADLNDFFLKLKGRVL